MLVGDGPQVNFFSIRPFIEYGRDKERIMRCPLGDSRDYETNIPDKLQKTNLKIEKNRDEMNRYHKFLPAVLLLLSTVLIIMNSRH